MHTFAFLQIAQASEGLSIQPTTVAFQALNFVILAVLLHKILYKPLIKLLNEREHKIREGVKNAQKAEISLKEANTVKQDILKSAKIESNAILEKSRKEGEEVKENIVGDARLEAAKIVKAGQAAIEGEKSKALQELQKHAVDLVVQATEKLLREKIDSARDAKIIEESIRSYSL